MLAPQKRKHCDKGMGMRMNRDKCVRRVRLDSYCDVARRSRAFPALYFNDKGAG